MQSFSRRNDRLDQKRTSLKGGMPHGDRTKGGEGKKWREETKGVRDFAKQKTAENLFTWAEPLQKREIEKRIDLETTIGGRVETRVLFYKQDPDAEG